MLVGLMCTHTTFYCRVRQEGMGESGEDMSSLTLSFENILALSLSLSLALLILSLVHSLPLSLVLALSLCPNPATICLMLNRRYISKARLSTY